MKSRSLRLLPVLGLVLWAMLAGQGVRGSVPAVTLGFESIQGEGNTVPAAFWGQYGIVVQEPGSFRAWTHPNLVMPAGRTKWVEHRTTTAVGPNLHCLTMTFLQLGGLDFFTVVRPGVSGGSSYPAWRIRAYNAQNSLLGTTGEGPIPNNMVFFGMAPTPASFTVNGPGIASVELCSHNGGGFGGPWATWNSIPLVEFSFSPAYAPSAPQLTLSPSQGTGPFMLLGRDFDANSEVTLTWQGSALPSVPLKVLTDANGAFSAQAAPLSQVPGQYTVAAQTSSGRRAEAVFTVTEAARPSFLYLEEGRKFLIMALNPNQLPAAGVAVSVADLATGGGVLQGNTGPGGYVIFTAPAVEGYRWFSVTAQGATPIPSRLLVVERGSLILLGDANGDGVVNILDLALVGAHFGSGSP